MDGRLEVFSKILNHDIFIEGRYGLKFLVDRLQVLQVYNPILDIFLLVLGVSFDFGLVAINKSLEVG